MLTHEGQRWHSSVGGGVVVMNQKPGLVPPPSKVVAFSFWFCPSKNQAIHSSFRSRQSHSELWIEQAPHLCSQKKLSTLPSWPTGSSRLSGAWWHFCHPNSWLGLPLHFENTNPRLVSSDDSGQKVWFIQAVLKVLFTHGHTGFLLFFCKDPWNEFWRQLGKFKVFLHDFVGRGTGHLGFLCNLWDGSPPILFQTLTDFCSCLWCVHRSWSTTSGLVLDVCSHVLVVEVAAPKSHSTLWHHSMTIDRIQTSPNLDGCVALMKEKLDVCTLVCCFGNGQCRHECRKQEKQAEECHVNPTEIAAQLMRRVSTVPALK